MKLSGETTTRMIIEGQPTWRADASFDGDSRQTTAHASSCTSRSAPTCGSSCCHCPTTSTGPARRTSTTSTCARSAAASALGIISGPLEVGGEMNAFHARGPLMVPGLGAVRSTSCSKATMPITWSTRLTTRSRTTRHRQPRRQARAPSKPAENGPKLLLYGDWRGLRWPLAARFTAETPQIFSQPRGQVPPRGSLAVRHHRERRSFRSAARSNDGRGARRAAQGSPADRRARLSAHSVASALLAGEARWSPEESWSLAGSVKGFNPGEPATRVQRLTRLQHERERHAFWRRRHARFRLQRSLRQTARQHRHRQRAHPAPGRELDLRQAAFSRRQHAAGHRRRTRRIARTQSRFQSRRRQPRVAGRGRARRAARQRAHRRHVRCARSSSSRRAAAKSSTAT